MINLKKYPDVGEGYISILANMPHSVGAGTWTNAINTAYPLCMLFHNSTSADGDNVNYYAYLAKGTYTIKMMCYQNTDAPIVKIKADGVTLATFDMYGAVDNDSIRTQAAISIAAAGVKLINLCVDGKNGLSSNYSCRPSIIQFYRTA